MNSSIWYKLSIDDILNNSHWGNNIWVKKRLEDYPLEEALRLNLLDGSFVKNEYLYYLKTDYTPIEIMGEEIDPLDVMYEERIINSKEFKEYVENDPTIAIEITDSEISWEDININEFAIKLLEEGYTLAEVAQDANALFLIDL